MNKARGLVCGVVLCGLAPWASAQQWYQGDSIRSGLLDVSNLYYSQANFGGTLLKEASDPDFYINRFAVTPGRNWNGAIGLEEVGSFNGNPLGTLVSGQVQTYFTAATHFGSVDPDVPVGVYDFTLEVLGGQTDTSMDVLATWDYRLDVRPRLDLAVSGSLDKSSVSTGETVRLSMTVENVGSDAALTTTWYVRGGPDSAAENMDWGWEFDPGWWDVPLDPGVPVTGLHSSYVPQGWTAPGHYRTPGGVIAGFHHGDEHMVEFSNDPGFDVVPEPMTAGLFAVAVAGLAVRRRR